MCNLLVLDPIWVSAIAAAIAAIAAVLYAFFTWKLIKEMREDRKLAYRPIIKAILIGDFYPDRLKFEIKNAGKGPALNLEFNCKDSDEGRWTVEKKTLPIGSLEKSEVIFLTETDSFKPGEEIFLEVEYSDILDKTYKDRLLTLKTIEVINTIGVTKKY